MGYAKNIKAWACPREVSRRDEAISQWAEMWFDARSDAVEPNGRDCAALTPQVQIGSRPDLISSLDSALAQQDA